MSRVGALLAIVLSAACADSREIVLIVRTSLPDELLDAVEETFEAQHATVDVRFSRSADDPLEELGGAEATPFDVLWGASGMTLERAASAGVLLPYRPTWVNGSGVDEETAWHPVLLTPFVIAFNREALPIGRVPIDWGDIFHHRWLEEVAAFDPERAEEGAYFLGATIVEALRDDDNFYAGLDWFARLEPQITRRVQNSDEAIRALQTQDALLAILPRADVEAARADDAPWIYYRLPTSGTPTLVRGVAIARGTEVAEAARAFVDHVGSLDVAVEAKRWTRWEPAHVEVIPARLPPDFELDLPWSGYPLAVDTLVSEVDGWVSRWSQEVRLR
jgi:ABC-type Fe3+ transport system substrate-binding protein